MPPKPIIPLTKPSLPVSSVRSRNASPRDIRSGFSPNQFDQQFVNDNFNRSLDQTGRRLTAQELVRISRTPLFNRAIERISNGVVAMPTVVSPPKNADGGSEVIQKTIERIEDSIREPNQGKHDTYTKFLKAIIKDLLIFGCALIERKKGFDPNFQAFWMWPVNIQWVKADPRWDAAWQDHPRFWYCPPQWSFQNWVPLYQEDVIFVTPRAATFEDVPPSPIEMAYNDMCAWLGLHHYKNETVTKAVRDYIICLKNQGQSSVDAFREYWENNVVGLGEIPIIGGEIDVQKFGARNDQELYPGHTEFLTGLIALEFGLLKSDFGYIDHANYSTADIANQASFQEGIRPIADCTTEHIHLKAVRHYYPGYGFGLADRNPAKEKDEAERSNTLFGGDISTRNEAREMNGLPPVPGGDKFKSGASALEEEEPVEQPAVPGAPPVPPAKDATADSPDPPKPPGAAPEKNKPKDSKNKKPEKVKIAASAHVADIVQLSLFDTGTFVQH
jgi:hypothetical protein